MSTEKIIECLEQKDFERASRYAASITIPRKHYFKILLLAVDMEANNFLRELLDKYSFDIGSSGEADKRCVRELLARAKEKDISVWNVLYEGAQKKSGYGKLENSELEEISRSRAAFAADAEKIVEYLTRDNCEEALRCALKTDVSRSLRLKIVQLAVDKEAVEILRHFIDKNGFDFSSSIAGDKNAALELFHRAKTKDFSIWKILYEENKKDLNGVKVNSEELKEIASSKEVSEAIRDITRFINFEVIDGNTLVEKKNISSDISLKILFNFESCQQTSIVKEGSALTMAVTDFCSISNRAFIDERHKIFLRLGGKEGLPYNPKKRAFLPPSPPLSS